MIEAGVYNNLSSEEYHADKDSLSRSSILDFHRNPYYYWAMHLNPDRPERVITPAMTFGSAFHTLVLEGDKFPDEYAIEPEKVFLKDVGREAYDEYKRKCEEIENSKKIILSKDEFNTLEAMANSLFNNERACELLQNGEIEKSFFWKDKESDLMIKARPDILQENMIIDLKTIADASAHSFQRAMVDGWYHVQGAMIRDAIRVHKGKDVNFVINICVEKKYPYCIAIYIIDEAALDFGEQLYKETLIKMKSSLLTSNFKHYPIQTIGLPKWSMM